MTVYAIGDVQGCYDELHTLLERLEFSPATDHLWMAGDLVNRGPKSLEVLRLVKSLGPAATVVLGNHDLHLLALWQKKHRHFACNDTLRPILEAEDRDELLDWLRRQPLMHFDGELGFAMVHAGLAPQWDLATALDEARKVEAVLQGSKFGDFLEHMYGNEPQRWSDNLSGWDRLRFAVNCFTRLRYCREDGSLSLKHKGTPGTQKAGLLPWFEVAGRQNITTPIVFGHWSALGLYHGNNVFALDTGCLWGGSLTALRLDGPYRTTWSLPCAGLPRLHDGVADE